MFYFTLTSLALNCLGAHKVGRLYALGVEGRPYTYGSSGFGVRETGVSLKTTTTAVRDGGGRSPSPRTRDTAFFGGKRSYYVRVARVRLMNPRGRPFRELRPSRRPGRAKETKKRLRDAESGAASTLRMSRAAQPRGAAATRVSLVHRALGAPVSSS